MAEPQKGNVGRTEAGDAEVKACTDALIKRHPEFRIYVETWPNGRNRFWIMRPEHPLSVTVVPPASPK